MAHSFGEAKWVEHTLTIVAAVYDRRGRGEKWKRRSQSAAAKFFNTQEDFWWPR